MAKHRKEYAPQGKHALPYNYLKDLTGALYESEYETLKVELGQELDTWQLIARDLARDIVSGTCRTSDSVYFARDVLNRLSRLPEMNIHPSEMSS